MQSSVKAIRITPANQDMLAAKFGVEDPDEQLPPGYILITDFGIDEHFNLLSPEKYIERFAEEGPIENGFVSVVQIQ